MNDVHVAINDEYSLREISAQEFSEIYSSRQEEYFSTSLIVDVSSHLTPDEQDRAQQRKALFPPAWRIQWALEYNGAVIGWTYSYQQDHETLYMCNTAIAQEHRGKGLYSIILQHVLSVAKTQGFQIVTSKHYASNNAIIVPKLKAGFIITGMALDEKYGLMVHLTKYLHPERQRIAINRIGESR